MTVFTDDFNRADGPLGNAWTVIWGSCSIASSRAVALGGVTVYRTDTPLAGSGYASVRLWIGSSGYQHAGIRANIDLATYSYYDFAITLDSGSVSAQILKLVGNTLSESSSSVALPGWVDGSTIRLERQGSDLVGFVANVEVCRLTDTALAAFAPIGFFTGAYGPSYDDWSSSTSAALSMGIDPGVMWAGGGRQWGTAVGSGTDWTIGIPGSSTLTCDHGTIDGQVTTSATAIQFWYTPAEYIGTVTFSESQYGLEAEVLMTARLPSGYTPLGGTLLSPQVLEWLEAQAAHGGLVLADNDTLAADTSGNPIKGALGEVLLGTRQQVGQADTTLASPALTYTLWQLLNGGYPPSVGPFPEPSFTSTDAGLGAIKAALDALVGEADWNLAELLFSLGGNPVVSTSDLASQISALDLSGGDAILAAISALRGSDTASVAAALSSLSALRTGDAYTLGSVKGWIDALPHGVDGPTAVAVLAVVAALALAIPTGGASIAAEAVAVGAGPLLDLTTLVEVVSIIGELAGIASSVNSIRESLTSAPVASPPTWPGVDGVTLAASVALVDGLVIDGPLHGVIVDLSTAPSGGSDWTIGGEHTYYNWGQVGFMNDRGDLEPLQFLGWRKGFYLPRTMASASSAHFRVLRSPVGTVRAFTIT